MSVWVGLASNTWGILNPRFLDSSANPAAGPHSLCVARPSLPRLSSCCVRTGTAPAVESRGVLQRMGPVDAGLGAAPQIIQQPAPGFAPAAGQPVQPQLMQPQVLQQPQPIQAQVVQAAVVPQQQPQMMMVTVPPGLQPGQMFAFTNLSGQSMQMAV